MNKIQKDQKIHKTNLTEGNIFGQLLRFSSPMILGNLLQQVYNIADTLIVGRYLGTDALAAVGSVYTLMIFITSIIIGLCMGSGAFFSADYGAKDECQFKEDVRLSFGFILSVTLVLNLMIYLFMVPILRILQTPVEIMELTREYVVVVFGGVLFIFLYNFFAYLLRAMGDSLTPLFFLAAASVLNCVLDVWFVVGLQLGVGGAALATVIAQAVSGIGLTVYTVRMVPDLWGKGTGLNWKRLREIVINDVATGIQQSVMNFGILMIQGLVNSFGTVIMAAFATAVKIDTIAYMPAQEFGNAYSLFVSQNYGAGKADRIRTGTRLSFVTAILFCALVSGLIFFFAGDCMSLFIAKEETAVIAEGIRYLRTEGAMYIGIGILFLWYGYFRGINRPQISLILTVISLGTRVVLSYIFAPHSALGVLAIWLSIPIGWILADGFGFYFYKREQGKEFSRYQ